MGQRSSTETIIGILQAFMQRRLWSQAELARSLDVSVPALRKRLLELQGNGIPLESTSEHPHVYWKAPRTWVPGGLALEPAEAIFLVRALVHQPKGEARDKLLAKLLGATPTAPASLEQAVVAPEPRLEENLYLATVEDSAARRTTLRMHYFSSLRGQREDRHASVQRVVIGPPARFVAVCHRAGELRWFRVDNILRANLEEEVPYRPADPARVEELLATSVDGFAAGPAVVVRFFVRDPESRWVQKNLPARMTVAPATGGIEVEARTAGMLPVARFVLGLGGAARPLSKELTAMVRVLAREALDAAATAEELVGGSVVAI